MDWLKKLINKKEHSVPFNSNLETADDYRARWNSVRVIYFTMFLMSLGFSIILTGIWPYLDKVSFMGFFKTEVKCMIFTSDGSNSG